MSLINFTLFLVFFTLFLVFFTQMLDYTCKLYRIGAEKNIEKLRESEGRMRLFYETEYEEIHKRYIGLK